MRIEREPAWMQPVVLFICLGIVGGLWFFGYPSAAGATFIAFCYLGLSNRFDEWQERRREDERAYDARAQRHEEVMRALHAIYYQAGGRGPSPWMVEEED